MLLKSNKVEIGYKIDNFSLLNIDNTYLEMQKIIKDNGLVIAFICNHCPYVKDIIVRLVEDFQYLQSLNVGTVAVMPNDADKYPEDSFENMKKFSTYYNFKFPYLYDKDQSLAKKLNAVCTPDFFCFDSTKKLFYRGRLDNIRYKEKSNNREKSLIDAFSKKIKDNIIEKNQLSSIGCSIKWK